VKSRMSKLGALCAAFIASIAVCSPAAHAQTYPARPIHVVVPFPPGGLNDTVIRIMQPYLQQKLGQTIVIDNKPGASGLIGTEQVAKAAPDGYTLLVVASSHTVAPATNMQMPFDTERDLAPVSLLIRDPLMFVASTKLGAKTLADFVALAKSKPGKLNYATPGTDSQSHFVTELFDERAGIQMVQVPYRGGAPAVLSLIAGETDFAVLSMQLSEPQIKAGKLVALASGGHERSAQFPNVPPLAESGYANLEGLQWVGMLAPAKTPADVIGKLNATVHDVLSLPDVQQKFAAQGVTAAPTSPEAFQELITSEVKQWKEVAKTAKIKPH
jgi:tripartite-type tricarboxylate transporter receptor subunit TctC